MRLAKIVISIVVILNLVAGCTKPIKLTTDEKDYLNQSYPLARQYFLYVDDFENYYKDSGESNGKRMLFYGLAFSSMKVELDKYTPPERFRDTHATFSSCVDDMGTVAIGYPIALNKNNTTRLNELHEKLNECKDKVQNVYDEFEKTYEQAGLKSEMKKRKSKADASFEETIKLAD